MGETQCQQYFGECLQSGVDVIGGHIERYFQFSAGLGEGVQSGTFPGEYQFAADAANSERLIGLPKVSCRVIEVFVLFEDRICGELKPEGVGVCEQLA